MLQQWSLVPTCVFFSIIIPKCDLLLHVQSNLSMKGTPGNLKMCPLWAGLTVMEYLFHKLPWYVPLVVNTSRSFPHTWLITGFITRLTWRVPLVEPELLTLPEHPSSPPVFSEVRVNTRSLVLCVCFVDRCLSFWTFSFGNCVFCSALIYGFWLPLWYQLSKKEPYRQWFVI
jgi:hypothetical protein